MDTTTLTVGLLLTGLCVGSFLTVVVHRLPAMIAAYEAGERPPFGLAWPPSACPSCDRRIRPWENVPLLAYAFLGGRCAGCRRPIGRRYPALELAGALVPVPALLVWGLDAQTLAFCGFGWLAIAITAIDLRHMLVPDALVLPIGLLGLAAAAGGLFVGPIPSVLGMAVGGLGLLAVQRAMTHGLGRPALGDGDVKLMAALGAWTGWEGLPLLILVAASGGLLAALAARAAGRLDRGSPLPFGPFLLAAAALVLLGLRIP